MSKLYELTGQINELNEMLESEGMEDAVKNTLELIEGEFSVKAENIIKLISNKGADLPAIDEEIKRLKKRKSTIENFQENLRSYLIENMQSGNINKISCPLFTVTLVEGAYKLEIDKEEILPDEYVNIEVTEKPDKRKILKDLKDGVEVPGAKKVRGNKSLRIS